MRRRRWDARRSEGIVGVARAINAATAASRRDHQRARRQRGYLVEVWLALGTREGLGDELRRPRVLQVRLRGHQGRQVCGRRRLCRRMHVCLVMHMPCTFCAFVRACVTPASLKIFFHSSGSSDSWRLIVTVSPSPVRRRRRAETRTTVTPIRRAHSTAPCLSRLQGPVVGGLKRASMPRGCDCVPPLRALVNVEAAFAASAALLGASQVGMSLNRDSISSARRDVRAFGRGILQGRVRKARHGSKSEQTCEQA